MSESEIRLQHVVPIQRGLAIWLEAVAPAEAARAVAAILEDDGYDHVDGLPESGLYAKGSSDGARRFTGTLAMRYELSTRAEVAQDGSTVVQLVYQQWNERLQNRRGCYLGPLGIFGTEAVTDYRMRDEAERLCTVFREKLTS